MTITKDMLIADAFAKCSQQEQEKVAEVLYGFGMHCLGCMLAHGENFEQAAAAHGANVDEMLTAINNALNA